MSEPLVTIGIPARNGATTLGETLRSVLAQTHRNLEVIVSDNASTDSTVAVARSFDDPRLRVLQQPRDLGAEKNSTACWNAARGAYTAVFHADDVYESTIVAREVAFLEAHPRAGAVFTRARYVDETGAPGQLSLLPPVLAKGDAGFDLREGMRLFARYGNFIMTPSVMVRTPILCDEIRGWRTAEFGKGADFDMWLRILERHDFGCLPEPLIRYRWGRLGFSAQYRRLRLETADYVRVLDHWLARPDVHDLLTERDRRSYRRVRRKHDVVRASNALLLGERDLAKKLMREASSLDVLLAALSSLRDFRVLLAFLAVRAGIAAPRTLRPALEYVSRRGS